MEKTTSGAKAIKITAADLEACEKATETRNLAIRTGLRAGAGAGKYAGKY